MDDKLVSKFIIGILAFSLILILVRFRFQGIILLLLIALVAGLYFGIKHLVRRRNDRKFAQTTEGQIQEKLNFCNQELEKHRIAAASIIENINDIKSSLETSTNLSERVVNDSRKLVQKFESALQLRNSKITFFETCIRKLENLLHNHLQAKALLEKEEQLRALQEEDLNDIAKMEEIRSNIEMDSFYLETIEDLSHQIQMSNDLDNTELINRELVKMTKDIERL